MEIVLHTKTVVNGEAKLVICWLSRSELQELVSIYGYNAGTPATGVNVLISTGSPNDIFYYHTNHLGSTAFVTDNNATVTQGFLYAPFGEITTEYNATFANGIIPKYAFNAKELDEETGMYYYEARYYKPPVFVSRDAMFEQKPWLSPYHYCSNNPVGRVDPSGQTDYNVETKNGTERKTIEDGFNGRIDVSKREFNKLERKYGRENGSYENYRDELKDKKGYTTGHPQGGIIFHQPKKNGYSVSAGVSFFCIIGGSFDIGYAQDGSGKGSLYMTGSFGVGLEAGVGVNYSSIPAKTSIGEFADPGGNGSINASIPYVSFGLSDDFDWNNTGVSFGPIKIGFSIRANKAMLLNPISVEDKADYYSNFGHIKR